MACCSATRILRITRCASQTENLTRGACVRRVCCSAIRSRQRPPQRQRAAPRRWPWTKTAAHGGAQQTPGPASGFRWIWRRSATSTLYRSILRMKHCRWTTRRTSTAIRAAARGISKRNRKSAVIRWKPARTAPPGSCCRRYPARAAMPISHFRSTSGRAMFA